MESGSTNKQTGSSISYCLTVKMELKMFAIFKFTFSEWECMGVMPTIEDAIDFRDREFDKSWESAIDMWEHHAIVSRIDADTTAIVRAELSEAKAKDDDTSNIWEAFTIKEMDLPNI